MDNVKKKKERVYQYESDPLSAYLKQINDYSLLTKDEELEISKRISECKDALSQIDSEYEEGCIDYQRYRDEKSRIRDTLEYHKNRMVQSNLRLVVSIAKKYQHRGLPLIDLISEGNIGLLEAVDRFDYRRNCRFSTYGIWWIQQAIKKALADKGKAIRIPVHVLNTIKKSHVASKFLTQEFGKDPTTEDLARYLNVPEKKIQELLNVSAEPASLDSPVDTAHATTLEELICSDNYDGPFDSAFRSNARDVVKESLDFLSEREQKVLELRFGIDGKDPLTLEGIGNVLGITRERVRQIQNSAIIKLGQVDYIKQLRNMI